MEENQLSQSFSVSGGQLSGVQIGGQSAGNLTVNQFQQNGMEISGEQLTASDVADLLDKFTALLQASDLSKSDKVKAIRSVEIAKDEVQADKPDKEFAAKSLQRATKVLKEVGETVDAGTSLWQKIKPIVETVSPWLGIATGFLI